MIETISMSAAELDEADIEAVLDVLRSQRLALGPRAAEFEQKMAAYVGVKHAVAVSSGTAALHLIVKALGLGPGDEVLVPSFTFAASVNAILYEGATPVFVDIEPDTYNLDPAQLAEHLTPRTRAVMVVDVFGHPAAWTEIDDFASRHGLKVIDDACEALGAQHAGRRCGQFGDAATFAFYPNKQITTGEGGIIVTDSTELAALCRSLSNQGRGKMGAWLEHELLGYNYRMNEMSAALGCSQLGRIEKFLRKRERVAALYHERLRDCELLKLQVTQPKARISWFVYVVTVAEGVDRDEIMRRLAAQGIPTRAYFSPLHLMPYIRERVGCSSAPLPVTESVARRTIALPFHNNLTPAQVDYIATHLLSALTSRS
jgi:perosamine synthetase